jgi:hypothetical protein
MTRGTREAQEPRPGAIEDPVPCHHSNKRRGKATRQGGQAAELQNYIARSRGCREFRGELFLFWSLDCARARVKRAEQICSRDSGGTVEVPGADAARRASYGLLLLLFYYSL